MKQSNFRSGPFFSSLAAGIIASGCASAPRILTVQSQPAEANVCIKGKFGSEKLESQLQCVGTTPFESDRITIQDKNGKKRTIHFNELDKDKESFYLVLNHKGYASEAVTVPAWDHHLTLKPETSETVAAVSSTTTKTGVVKITSEPIGALVYINDTLRGNTPFAYEGQPGMAKVKIEYPERTPYEGIMNINAGESRELNIKLLLSKKEEGTPQKSMVRIDSVPAGALLYVDNAVKGNAPYTYAGNAGESVRVRLEMSGYSPIEKVVKLGDSGKEMNVVLQMEQRSPASTISDEEPEEVANNP